MEQILLEPRALWREVPMERRGILGLPVSRMFSLLPSTMSKVLLSFKMQMQRAWTDTWAWSKQTRSVCPSFRSRLPSIHWGFEGLRVIRYYSILHWNDLKFESENQIAGVFGGYNLTESHFVTLSQSVTLRHKVLRYATKLPTGASSIFISDYPLLISECLNVEQFSKLSASWFHSTPLQN